MRVLLGSGGISTEERREMFQKLASLHFSNSTQILFIPYASHDHSSYTARVESLLTHQSEINILEGTPVRRVVGIHSFRDEIAAEAVAAADAIYVGGGNSFLLAKELHDRGLVEPIRSAVFRGASYLGISAGANVACRTMMTTNDMPIVHPPSFESFGIVPFQINPHYYPGKLLFDDGKELARHYGESREQRINEFHRLEDTPVLGMWEGSFVQWDGSKGRLYGRATAFLPGESPVEIHDGSEFDARLMVS